MANLNITEQFWIDIIEVAAAAGSSDLAVGNALRFFRYAQQVHKKGRLISEEDFKDRKFSEALFPLFAERVEGGIQAKGAGKYFDWLLDKQEAGSEGGKKSAKRPRDEKGRLLSKSAIEAQQNPSESNDHPSSIQATPSEPEVSKQIQPIPISIPSLISNSSSSRELRSPASAGGLKSIGGESGVIPELAGGNNILISSLQSVPKSLQRTWLDYWPDQERIVLRSLEKAVLYFAGKGIAPQNIGLAFTKWLWQERDLKARRVYPKPGEVFETNFIAFESLLKTHGVSSAADLIGMLEEGA